MGLTLDLGPPGDKEFQSLAISGKKLFLFILSFIFTLFYVDFQ